MKLESVENVVTLVARLMKALAWWMRSLTWQLRVYYFTGIMSALFVWKRKDRQQSLVARSARQTHKRTTWSRRHSKRTGRKAHSSEWPATAICHQLQPTLRANRVMRIFLESPRSRFLHRGRKVRRKRKFYDDPTFVPLAGLYVKDV